MLRHFRSAAWESGKDEGLDALNGCDLFRSSEPESAEASDRSVGRWADDRTGVEKGFPGGDAEDCEDDDAERTFGVGVGNVLETECSVCERSVDVLSPEGSNDGV